VKREQQARALAEASDAFKEVFLGILGHDLRNPLNTVLTTARLMTLRRELPADGQKKVDRIVSSVVRMQRMIEQLMDVTRARLTAGIPVKLSDHEPELLPFVSKIVDEIRVAHPARTIDLKSEGSCRTRIDGDRFEDEPCRIHGVDGGLPDGARVLAKHGRD